MYNYCYILCAFREGLAIFWDRFYSLCIENNTKPNPVAQKLGYSNAICNKWKNGSTPGIDALIKISEYFNVSIEFLIGKTDIKKEQVTPTEQPVDEIDKEILELTADMTEEEKNSVLGYAARLVAKHKKED